MFARGFAFRSTQAAAPAYLLDGLATAPFAAWGTGRQLSSAYAGPIIRVRRTSGSPTEDDIPLSGGVLDTTALTTFCGVGVDGYVVTYYDLTGNGRHQTQATAGLQMRIVANGVIDVTAGGKPIAITPDSTDRGYGTAAFTAYTGTAMAMAWCGVLSTRAGGRMLSLVTDALGDYNSTSRAGFIRVSTNAQINHLRNLGNFATRSISNGELAAYGSRTDGTNAITYTASGNTSQAQTNAYDVNRILMGLQETATARGGTGHKICEGIVWLADPGATELTNVLADQRTYYGAA